MIIQARRLELIYINIPELRERPSLVSARRDK